MIDSKAVVQAHNLFMTFKAENKIQQILVQLLI